MTITIQVTGGTRKSIDEGRNRRTYHRTAPGDEQHSAFIAETRAALDAIPTVPMDVSELVVGTVCGGSDGTSGITGNPAAGRAFDMLVRDGAACIFEETGELIGCEQIMASRAVFFGIASLGVRIPAGVAAVIALVINIAAYTCEIVRAGIESVHKGQVEVAECLGMSRAQVYWYRPSS